MFLQLSDTYIPTVGIGALIAVPIFLYYDSYLQKSKIQGKNWAQSEEYRRLPLACAGGPLFAISQFWLVSKRFTKTRPFETLTILL